MLRLKEDNPPEQGIPLHVALDVVCGRAAKGGYNTASGGFCAMLSGGGMLHTSVADMVGDVLHRSTGVFLAAPGFVQLECNVIKWMCKIVKYPPGSFGCLTSGGTMANFIGLLAARRHHLPEEEISKGVVFVSSETHMCVAKGAIMAGLPKSCICEVRCDERLRMDPQALEEAIISARKAGKKPFLVTATAGTTNAGTIDDLDAIASVCERQSVWLHVDGVYGAAFNLTERGQKVLIGLERADSVAIDLHKSFFLANGSGLLLVKEGQTLRNAFTLHHSSPFFPELGTTDINFFEFSPELTRSFRGLRLWLPIQLCGLQKWRQALDERLDWTEKFVSGLNALARRGVEVHNKPELSIVVFRYTPLTPSSTVAAGDSDVPDAREETTAQREDELKRLNIRLLNFINGRNNILLSATTLPGGRLVLRICILHIRLTWRRLEQGLHDIADGVNELQHM